MIPVSLVCPEALWGLSKFPGEMRTVVEYVTRERHRGWGSRSISVISLQLTPSVLSGTAITDRHRTSLALVIRDWLNLMPVLRFRPYQEFSYVSSM